MKQGEKSVYSRLKTDLGDVDIMHARYVGQNFARHSHAGYGLGVITEGALEFWYRGETLIAGKGYVNSVNPDEVHDGHSYDIKDGWSYSMLYFGEEVFRNIYHEMSETYKTPYIQSGVIKDIRLAASIAELTSGALRGCGELFTESRLIEVLSSAVGGYSDKRPDKKHYRLGSKLSKVKEYIADNIDKKITLKDLSDQAGLSRYHFLRSFREDCGIAPYEYTASVRANAAKKMLLAGIKPAETAAACGYTDQSHMNRWLKKLYGITPSNIKAV